MQVSECEKVEQYLKLSLQKYENHKAMIINRIIDNNTGMINLSLCLSVFF